MSNTPDRITIYVTFKQLAALVGGAVKDGILTLTNASLQTVANLPLTLGEHDLGTWSVDHVEAIYGPATGPDDDLYPGRTYFAVNLRKGYQS